MRRLLALLAVISLAVAIVGFGAAWAQEAAAAASQAASAPSTAIEVSAEGPKEPVEFGKPFEVVVTRRWNANETAPPWNPGILSPLVLALGAPVETQRNGDAFTERRRLTARAFVREEVNIPKLGLRVKIASSLPAEPGKVEPPPGPYDPRFDWPRAFVMIGIGLAVLASALVAFLWWTHKTTQPPPPPPRVPPHERALARLAALRSMPVPDEPAVQRFHVEASAIVRDYIEERFGVHAPEMTTEEFLNAKETHEALADAHRAVLAAFLDQCDLVKFARHASTGADRGRLCAAAERLVQETRILIANESKMTEAVGAPPTAGAPA
mgnify:CR=1 FL=1